MKRTLHHSLEIRMPGFRGGASVTRAILLVTGLVVAALGPAPAAQATIDPGSVSGTVTDDTNIPLPGITVSVIRVGIYGDIEAVLGQDETDANGAFQVDDLAAYPSYRVRFTDPSAEYATEFYADNVAAGSATSVPVTAFDVTTGVDASLEPAASISGQVTTANGAPVTSGQVWLTWLSPSGGGARMDTHFTDQAGHYSIVGVKSATYALAFWDPATNNAEWWDDKPWENMSGALSATPLVVKSGDSFTGINAVLGGTVTNVEVPSVTGKAQVGQSLTASAGTWTPLGTTVSYRWIVGADTMASDDPTGAVYWPTPADVGKTIRVYATGTRSGWLAGSAYSNPTAAVVASPVTTPPAAVTYLVRPRVKGTLQVGHVVRVSKGVWHPTTVTLKYQWYAGGKAITDATHRRLTLTAKYAGRRLTVRIKVTAAGYDRAIVWTKPTARIQS